MFSPTFPDLQGLVSHADTTGTDIRPTLFRVLTDLYVQKPTHSVDEERHYTELATRLIEGVDARTRAAVAGKLAAYPGAPQPVLDQLRLAAESAVAWTIPPSMMHAPSVATQNPDTARELSELFFSADVEERRLIMVNLDYASLAPAEPLSPARAADAVHRLEFAALMQKPNAFATILEQFLAIPSSCAARLVEDASGESVLVAARALAMPAEVFHRIILLLNPAVGQSVECVYDLAQLYEQVSQNSALRLVAIWRASEAVAVKAPVSAAPPVQSGAYRPVHYNDETSRARDMTAHNARRANTRTVEQHRATRRRDPA